MPSIFTLQGPQMGMPNITALNDYNYGQQFIRRIGPPIAGPLGIGVLPGFGTLVLMGASAAAGIFGYKWWMKRKRRK